VKERVYDFRGRQLKLVGFRSDICLPESIKRAFFGLLVVFRTASTSTGGGAAGCFWYNSWSTFSFTTEEYTSMSLSKPFWLLHFVDATNSFYSTSRHLSRESSFHRLALLTLRREIPTRWLMNVGLVSLIRGRCEATSRSNEFPKIGWHKANKNRLIDPGSDRLQSKGTARRLERRIDKPFFNDGSLFVTFLSIPGGESKLEVVYPGWLNPRKKHQSLSWLEHR